MKELLRNLADQGLLSAEAVQRICAMHRDGELLDDALLEHAGAGEGQARLLRALAAEFDMPFVDLKDHRPQPELLARFPARILLEYRLLPLESQNGSMLVATSRAFDSTGLDELRLATGTPCRPALAAPEDLERCIKQALGVGADTVQTLVADARNGGIEVIANGEALLAARRPQS